MLLFNILVILFFILIILVISSTIIKTSLFFINRCKYENYILIVPAVLSVMSWAITLILLFITLSITFKENFINFIIDKILNHISLNQYYQNILIPCICFSIICIILQNFSFMTVNIDYTKINGNLRINIKKLFKLKLNKNNSNQIILTNFTKRLSLKAALLSSILTFSLVIFFSLTLFSIGKIISNNII